MSHFTLGVVSVGGGECRGGECRTILLLSTKIANTAFGLNIVKVFLCRISFNNNYSEILFAMSGLSVDL